jgi:hypothetical protein
MSNCPFYHAHPQVLRSREIRSDRQSNDVHIIVRYCEHKHSPAPRGTIGSSATLQCGGAVEKCQVPEEKRADAYR